MKKAVIVVVILLAGLLAYNYLSTGEITLIPSFTQSEEERELSALEDRFDAAVKQYSQAARSAGMAGIDTTTDAEAARLAARQVGKELKALRERLSSEADRTRAEKLTAAVRKFVEDLN